MRICFDGAKTLVEVGYGDSDLARDVKDNKFVRGYESMVSGGTVSRLFRKKTSVETSTCKTKYIAI